MKWNDKDELIWKEITQAGTYTFKLTDAEQKSKSVDFVVNCNSINLSNLDNLNMQVGQKIDNLLEWISIPKGIEIDKIEIEIDGQRTEIKKSDNGYEYKPNRTWTCYIYITEKWEFGNTYVQKSNPLTIKDIEHQEHESISITNIKPVDILPIIWQVETWDKNVYSHIEHLRIAEATRIRDMMRKYGTWQHSPEEYQQLMLRLNTGMTLETPNDDNYEFIWTYKEGLSDHATILRSIIKTLVKHANLKVVNPVTGTPRYNCILDFINEHPNSINIFWNSLWGPTRNKNEYKRMCDTENLKILCESGKFILFAAGTNITNSSSWPINVICNEEYELDENRTYWLPSFANSDNNTHPKRAVYPTIATNKDWNINQTGITQESSRYPKHFADNVLFSGRGFPEIREGKIYWPSWRYKTSDTNYLNVALTDICFQMFACVKDVYELMDMIRYTALKDYITLDEETQELQLINPAWFFREYCMTADIPYSIQPGQTIPLNKTRYKWLIFDIPWAEVKINWEWIEYCKSNESLIKSQNPMNLEWRLNGDLVAKYSKNGAVTWKVIAVDDERNGLNMEKDNVTINLNRGVEWSMVDIPYGIRAWETIMLTNWSTKWLIYDIPWAQVYIPWKSWVTYNDKTKKLIESQDLKNAYWRLNWDIARKTTRNTYIKWRVFAVDDKWNIIDHRKVYVNLENDIRNHNSYIAQWYEWKYQTRAEWWYNKNVWKYQTRAEWWYNKNVWNYGKHTA